MKNVPWWESARGWMSLGFVEGAVMDAGRAGWGSGVGEGCPRRGPGRPIWVNEAGGAGGGGGVTAQAEEEASVKEERLGQHGGTHTSECCSWFLWHEAGRTGPGTRSPRSPQRGPREGMTGPGQSEWGLSCRWGMQPGAATAPRRWCRLGPGWRPAEAEERTESES